MKSNNRWPVEERRLIRLTGYVIKFLCIALFTAFILCLSASAMNEFNTVEFIWRLLQQLLPPIRSTGALLGGDHRCLRIESINRSTTSNPPGQPYPLGYG